ncbi:hypothetical protein [Methylobacterium durans]|uniref:Uncharacterized protein n=1 Tax=Methylobacterium durans TaxID=2202825 RepID=A0A2U8W4W1_9HYPH|nr:hypothetical protein [Methylobacterium durans]AWN40661.1 hypothetical protein DK389_09130 [Methylobacterium durans]
MLQPSARPLAALILLAFVVAVIAAVATLRHSLPWYTGLALFYAGVAAAELAYLALCLVRDPGRRSPAQGGRKTAA